jgi:hypothetical protein
MKRNDNLSYRKFYSCFSFLGHNCPTHTVSKDRHLEEKQENKKSV